MQVLYFISIVYCWAEGREVGVPASCSHHHVSASSGRQDRCTEAGPAVLHPLWLQSCAASCFSEHLLPNGSSYKLLFVHTHAFFRYRTYSLPNINHMRGKSLYTKHERYYLRPIVTYHHIIITYHAGKYLNVLHCISCSTLKLLQKKK